LNASEKEKIVNNLTVMTNVSTAYAPAGKVLISVSCNGSFDFSDLELAQKKNRIATWFGNK
jgi:predicted cupin superfamily sugar epimerase